MRWLQVLVFAGFLAPTMAQGIDQTCATCDRRVLDSLNYHDIEPIRVNQVGYRTQEHHKIAFVAGTTATAPATLFSVIDSAGVVAYTGSLQFLKRYDSLRARMLIKGYYNSINVLYTMGDSTNAPQPEYLWKVDFGPLAKEGTYRVLVGRDTSHPFDIRKTIYNDVFETSLKFFGAQRCGNTDSWFHKACHTKDGSALGHAGELQGGWHDCGDHGKYAETEGYAASMLALAYTAMPEKAEDRYGASYDDTIPFGNDGIPDLLWEAKVGADYIYRLYNRSKIDGLVATGDMYHTVGNGPGMDHLFWDRPEYQDAQAQSKGGPDRPVLKGIGTNVAGMFVVSLALVGAAWEPFDPVYSKSLVDAAIDIYDNIIKKNLYRKTTTMCCYDGGGQQQDDPAFAAVALWYATKQARFGYDLWQNPSLGSNPGSIFNIGEFAAGLLGNGPITGAVRTQGYFDHGGWTTDFQQTNQLALYAFGKLILRDTATALKYGIGPALRDSVLLDVVTDLKRGISIGSNGSDNAAFPGMNVDQPYHGVFTSAGWGFNRYNMGMVTEIFMYWDLMQATGFWKSMKGKTVPGRLNRPEVATFVNGWTESVDSMYLQVGIDNMNYQLGLNPWDLSFVMGAGAKNLQHPHNRAANPEGYNAGGVPYKYKVPKGALMGGCKPGSLLKDYWLDYTVTETCIDFSAQLVLPSQILAEDLPPDTVGPQFKNVVVVDIRDTSALVTWQTNELSRDTLFYSLTPGGPLVGSVPVALAKNKSAFLGGLTPNTTYYFWFKGMDIYRNVSYDDNRGRYYQFTTLSGPPPAPAITDIRVCNIRSDRATVFWWTDVPSSSAVEYAVEGANFATTKVRVNLDDEGIPGRFHKVTLKGLVPGTTYRYDVISGSAREDSGGLHRRFQTTQDFADYTIMMKADKKNITTSGNGAHFYLLITNNDPKPYAGLELRFYFKATAAVAKAMVVNTSDNAIWGGGGTVIGTGHDSIGPAQPYGTSGNIWYFPIIIRDTIPVSGSARIEMKMDSTNWKPVNFSAFADAWSVAPHTAPPDPLPFAGIDMAHPWDGPEQIETRNGVNYVTYTDDPYITAHYKGVHIYGYPPDGAKPRVFRTTEFAFSKPLPSPATSVRQDTFPVHFGGRTWSFPDVVAAQWQVDAPLVRASTPLAGQTDSVAFGHDTADAQGATSHEFAFWGDRDSSYCSCAWQRYLVTVDTMKNPPRQLRLVWSPSGPVDGWTSSRTAVTLKLVDSAGQTLDTTATIVLSNSNSGFALWASNTGGVATSSVVLVSGTAQVWVSSATADSSRVSASASIPGSTVASGSVWVRFTNKPPRRLSLAWTPAGPIDAWSGGQRKSATLTLLDSAGALLDTTAVANLTSSATTVQFWAATSGGMPLISIPLVHGSAVVWFSDALADTATLTAGAVIAGSAVTNGTLVVRFAATPPWPLVDSAWTTDGSCDGIPDSVVVRLSLPLDAGSVLQSATLVLGGQNLSIPAATAVVVGRDVLLPVPAGLAGSATGTGVLSLHVTTGGRDQIVQDSFPVLDRVRPQLASAAVMERFGIGNDTVRAEFSEPVATPTTWPFAVAGATDPASVVSVRKLSPTLIEWVLSGSSFPAPATVGVASAEAVRDLAGNGLATCAVAVPLQVTTKPDPMISAAVADPAGTGLASTVVIRFARAVRDVDLPDSLSVLWDGTPRSVPLANIARSATDSSVLVGTLSVPSPAGSGLRAGGTGIVQFIKGTGASGRRDSIAARDSVGPALRSAILRVGAVSDTLVLRISESALEGPLPVQDLLLRSGIAVPASAYHFHGPDSGRWILALPSGAVVAGDSLRLAGIALGAWRDQSANSAAPNAPWIPVKVGDRAPATATAYDPDGDGRVSQVVLNWASAPSQRHELVLVWPDSSGRPQVHAIDSTMGAWNANTLTLSVSWPFGATSGPGQGLQVNRYDDGSVDTLPFAIQDGAAPVVVYARLGYAAPGQSTDTLVVRFSESAKLHGSVVVRVRSKDGTVQDVSSLPWRPSNDGLWAYLPLDPTINEFTRFQKGDAVQAAPGASGVSDAVGNFALDSGHFEPVQFGRRPPRFSLGFEPGKTVEDGGPVPATEPAVRVLVRSYGSTGWKNLDGTPADLSIVRLGPKILSNGPLNGELNLFDNMGTHVVTRKLDDLNAAVENGTIPSDPSGQWEAWIAWDGRSPEGRIAASGVYAMRLVLHRPSDDGKGWSGWLNKVYRIGWIRKN